MADYRTIIGFVKYEPREGTAKLNNGDEVEVRNFVIRQTGMKEQAQDVRATLWPSHDHVEVAQGDLVAVEGKFSVNKGKDADGEPQTYFNLSVSGFTKLGEADFGEREEQEERSNRRRKRKDADEASEGDEPW